MTEYTIGVEEVVGGVKVERKVGRYAAVELKGTRLCADERQPG